MYGSGCKTTIKLMPTLCMNFTIPSFRIKIPQSELLEAEVLEAITSTYVAPIAAIMRAVKSYLKLA